MDSQCLFRNFLPKGFLSLCYDQWAHSIYLHQPAPMQKIAVQCTSSLVFRLAALVNQIWQCVPWCRSEIE